MTDQRQKKIWGRKCVLMNLPAALSSGDFFALRFFCLSFLLVAADGRAGWFVSFMVLLWFRPKAGLGFIRVSSVFNLWLNLDAVCSQDWLSIRGSRRSPFLRSKIRHAAGIHPQNWLREKNVVLDVTNSIPASINKPTCMGYMSCIGVTIVKGPSSAIILSISPAHLRRHR